MHGPHIERYLFLSLFLALYFLSPLINAEIDQKNSFTAQCIPGKGTEYWYDRRENQITHDEWIELDGSGFTGGAYVFRYTGGSEVTLGKKQFPIQAQNGPVIIFTSVQQSATTLRSDTFLIHIKLRKIIHNYMESFEFARGDQSTLRTVTTKMECDWQ